MSLEHDQAFRSQISQSHNLKILWVLTACDRPLNFKKNSIVRYPNRVELGPVSKLGPVSSCPCEFLGRLRPGRGLLLVLTTVIRVLHVP